jgi:CheY-like chemotaxis protein
VAEFLRTLLAARGHDARVAHDGPSALSVAAAFQPQVVVMDLGLPGMDGCEAARRLRGTPGLGQALFVAATGEDGDQVRARAADAGFALLLGKPFARVELDSLLAVLSAPLL